MIVKYSICPTCNSAYDSIKEAELCRNKHPINNQTWLMCECGWGVRADMNWQADAEYKKHKEKCNHEKNNIMQILQI
jgi:hypothetical protein